MNTSSSGTSTQSPHGHRTIVALLIFLLLMAIAAVWFWISSTSTITTTRPVDLPVEEPDVTSMGEIAALTDGKPVPPVFPGITLPPIDEGDHVFGSSSANISVVEYTNFGNTYARLLHPDLRSLVQTSNGQINWIVRHFPLSEAEYFPAEAAECAYFQTADHGTFWSYFDKTFSSPPKDTASATSVAVSLGLDQTIFENCMRDHHTYDHILGDSQDGRLDAKVSIVPSFVVINHTTNDVRLIEGVNTIEYVQKVVNAVR